MLGGVATSTSSLPTLLREFVRRRISEGETGRLKHELRCEACGKGYKHISSLAKHLWEHTPEWRVTRRLLMLKHQQVQLLEAASILVGMNMNDSNSVAGPGSSIAYEHRHMRRYSTLDRTDCGKSDVNDVLHANDQYRRNGRRAYLASQYPPLGFSRRASIARKSSPTFLANFRTTLDTGSLALMSDDDE